MAKSTKRQRPAVYVTRGDKCSCGDKGCSDSVRERVRIPVNRGGVRTMDTVSICYSQFSRITGIKLKPGEVAKVRITGKKLKR